MSLTDDLASIEAQIQKLASSQNGHVQSVTRADGTSTNYLTINELLSARDRLKQQIQQENTGNLSAYRPVRFARRGLQ
jgi:hypothetical protein